MRLYAIFLILNVQLSHISASPPQTNHNLNGYECGNFFFTDVEVKKTLSLARASIDKGYRYPLLYIGELYSESKIEEHFLYPIKNNAQFMPHIKHANTVFFIVLTRKSNEEIGVVAKITIGEYTKCIRRGGPHKGPSQSVPEIPNGYLCGHKFIDYMAIHHILAEVQAKVDESTKYSFPYVGRLYPQHIGHQLWPIINGERLYTPGTANVGPYFLILNNERQFVDVAVRGFSNNYLRCIRSRKLPKAPASDSFSKLFVPPPKSGYLCGKIFFDDKILEENVKIAKSEDGYANGRKFPVEYSGPPFNERCLIWPLLQDGSLSRRGHKGPYRLILTKENNILTVAMLIRGKYKACERDTIAGKKDHDTSDYLCNKQYFSHLQLVMAAEEACEKLKITTDHFYPASYEGPGFKLGGPYFTYPVIRKDAKEFRYNAGLHRVVINAKCEVVGALTTIRTSNNGHTRKALARCHRVNDGSIPPGFFEANAQIVSEHKARY